MATGRAIILGTQLKKARRTVQFDEQEVARRLRVDRQTIVNWEAEREAPTLKELESLAALYGREIDYFLRETPALPAEIQFRSRTKQSFTELTEKARKVIARFDELCRTAYELERALGKIVQPRIGHASKSQSPTELAAEQRKALDLGVRPVGKLRDFLSKIGLRIFELVVPGREFSGFSCMHPDYGPCILINAKDVPGRRNFTILHEFAHLLYRHEPCVCDIAEEIGAGATVDERQANLFAVEFLLPAQQVKDDFARRGLSSTPLVQDVGKMAGKWAASVEAMFYRLEELGLVKRDYGRTVLASYEPQVVGKKSPLPAWKRRLGEVYVSDAIRAYREGHISLGKLAHCLGLPIRKALEEAERQAAAS